jgi:hypothetical protein
MVNNFVIDHVLRGIMTKKNGDYMWSINQISNPSLNVSLSDTAQAVDALGTPIVEFDRGRSAEFSAENSIFDLSLYAAQMGRGVEIAGEEVEGKKTVIEVPAFEEFEVDGETYVTKKAPIADLTKIYVLNQDGTLGKSYEVGTASDSAFAYDSETHTITLPTGLEKGTAMFVMYEYEAEENATAVTADAINFPKAGVFTMEVLGTSVCDPDTLIHAFVKFPNAKLDGNVDYTFATDGTHPFTIKAMQEYCDREKKLFSIIIPEEE